LVADDDLRPDADDSFPGDDGVAVHLRLSGPAAAVGADAVALEDAEFAGGEAGYPQASSVEFSADVVDPAQLLTGLGDDLSVQEFRGTDLGAKGRFGVFDRADDQNVPHTRNPTPRRPGTAVTWIRRVSRPDRCLAKACAEPSSYQIT
jgi:hypothetical protein